LRSNQDTIVDSDSEDGPDSDEDDNAFMQIHDGLEEDEYEHHADEYTSSREGSYG
jgi:hypothetical protein